jgi:hypothetical protein
MWDLDEEIPKATGARDVHDGLRKVGICRDRCRDCQIDTVHDWRPDGAETYVYRFEVRHGDCEISALTLRACVALTGFDGVGTIAEQWAERRRLLARHGLKVPVTYWVEGGCIAEEHLAFTLAEAWRTCAAQRPFLAQHLGEFCGTPAVCRFHPVALTGLRSHGDDIVLVDAGSDLGAPWCDAVDTDYIIRLGSRLVDEVDGDSIQLHHGLFQSGLRHDRARTPP